MYGTVAPGQGQGSGQGHPCTVDTFLVFLFFCIIYGKWHLKQIQWLLSANRYLTFTTLRANSADDILLSFSYFSKKKKKTALTVHANGLQRRPVA